MKDFGRWILMKLQSGQRVTKISVFFCILWTTIAVLSSISEASSDPSGKLVVYTVNYPLKYFAERIGGENVLVEFPAPPDVDPGFWNPGVATITSYQQADLIILNGAGYAKWVDKVSLPRSKLVNTTKKYQDRYITIEGAVTHSHGPEGKHAHEAVAFTTWIDFDLATKQAQAITTALSRKKPSLRETFKKNYAALEKDLMALDRVIKGIVSKDLSKPLVVSHPVYDYFSKRYGLNIKSVHWEPDEIPDNGSWVELRTILKGHPAKWMIWEAEPNTVTVEKLKSNKINSIVFNPCSNAPKNGDFMSVMQQNVEHLKLVFK
jgi:zinc transport system substrate-binding protein